MMKKIAILFFMMSSLLWGQSFNNQQLLNRIGLDETQIEEILEMEEEFTIVKREAAVEQNFYKAQLERLLLKPNPNMAEVEEVLRNSMEWKLKETLAGINHRVEVRKIVGEERWVRLLRLTAELRQRNAETRQQNRQ